MTHVLELLATYTPFFTTHLQPVFREQLHGTELETIPAYSDAVSAFITALLPMLRRKIFNLLPKIAHQPQLLSHFVHELITFDTALRDQWGYKPIPQQKLWKGLTWEVLVEKNWFGRWLQVEKDCE